MLSGSQKKKKKAKNKKVEVWLLVKLHSLKPWHNQYILYQDTILYCIVFYVTIAYILDIKKINMRYTAHQFKNDPQI